MTDPLLPCPPAWTMTSLAPTRGGKYITEVDSGGTPSTSKEENWDGDIPWLTPKEITRNEQNIYVSTTERRISETGLANSAAKLLPTGTVLLTKRAPVGSVAINTVPMATNQGFLNFHCGEGLLPLFLATWFRLNSRYLNQVANGSTYRELYKSDLFEFNISIPSIEEQKSIVGVIRAMQYVTLLGSPLEQSLECTDQMLEIQSQNKALEHISADLAWKLFSGEVTTKSVVSNFNRHVV